LNSTNTVLQLGATVYKIDNKGLIYMDKVYANQITTAPSDTGAGVWLTNHNSGAIALKSDTASVFNSDIINSTVAPYQSLVIIGNKSSGARKIQLFDEVSLPSPNAKFCIGTTCIDESQLKQLVRPDISNTGTPYKPSDFYALATGNGSRVYHHTVQTNVGFRDVETFVSGSTAVRIRQTAKDTLFDATDAVLNTINQTTYTRHSMGTKAQIAADRTRDAWSPWVEVNAKTLADARTYADQTEIDAIASAKTYADTTFATRASLTAYPKRTDFLVTLNNSSGNGSVIPTDASKRGGFWNYNTVAF
jgi:hypothetical protein